MTRQPVLDPFQPASSPVLNGHEPAPEIRAEMTEITPAMAREWMQRHKATVEANGIARGGKARDNRPVKWNDVACYARDMKAGNWVRNGETIKIARDGTVIDGQHRLYACMQAEVPFWTLVVTGVEPEAQDTIDAGAKRKLSDQLAIAHEKNAAVLASVTRWGLRWVHGERGSARGIGGGAFTPTPAEMLAFLAATPRLREAADWAVHARNTFKPVRCSAYAMAWMLFTGIDDIAARAFLESVLDGAGLPSGHPALAFRARMINSVTSEERLSEQEHLALLILAWNAFREDRTLTRMQLPKGGLTVKNFPEPK